MKYRSNVIKSIQVSLVILFLLILVRWEFFEPFVIPSGSMIPTLLVNDHIIVEKWKYGIRIPFTNNWLVKFNGPSRGDIVVFRSVENMDYYLIKRVIGIAGDEVKISNNGDIFINGEIVPKTSTPIENDHFNSLISLDEYQIQKSKDQFDFFEEFLDNKSYKIMIKKKSEESSEFDYYKVPNDHLFVMGDNRDRSQDSRFWGFLPLENLLGRASYIWLSCQETLPDTPFLCNPKTIRWKRLFSKIQ